MRETTYTAPRTDRGRDPRTLPADAVQAAHGCVRSMHSVRGTHRSHHVCLMSRNAPRADEAAHRRRASEHPVEKLCFIGSSEFYAACARYTREADDASKTFHALTCEAKPSSQNRFNQGLDDGHWIFDRFCPQEGRAPAGAREDSPADPRPRSHRKTASPKRVRPISIPG
jgi:hypothetical protein